MDSGLLLLIGSSPTARNPSFYNFHLPISFSSRSSYGKKMTIVTPSLSRQRCHIPTTRDLSSAKCFGSPHTNGHQRANSNVHPPIAKLDIRRACGARVRVPSAIQRVGTTPRVTLAEVTSASSSEPHKDNTLPRERSSVLLSAESCGEHGTKSGA